MPSTRCKIPSTKNGAMKFEIIHISETDSTNRWLQDHPEAGDVLVWTDYQTAGRGCGTNHWESERGKNLLFSVRYSPKNVPAASQFILSMANALALKTALSDYTDGITIKWPNDLYWNDRKICGTLIETSLQGMAIRHCIIGTGINVNQTRFLSDAPNPVSLAQLLRHEVRREEVLQKIVDCTQHYMQAVEEGQWESLRSLYRQSLYRLQQQHQYRFADGHTELCTLTNVTDDGHLQLLSCEGKLFSMAFKEVQFVINDKTT